MTRRPLLPALLTTLALSPDLGCDNPKRPATPGTTAEATTAGTTAGGTTAGAATGSAEACPEGIIEVFWCKLKGGGEIRVCGQVVNDKFTTEQLRVTGTIQGKPLDLTFKDKEISNASYWSATGPIANSHALQLPTSETTSITPYTITLKGKLLGEGVWLGRKRTAEDDKKAPVEAPVQMPSSHSKKLPVPDVQTGDVPCEGAARHQLPAYTSAPLTRIDQQWPYELGAIPHEHTSVP